MRAQCQPKLATGSDDKKNAEGGGGHGVQAGEDGAKRDRTPSKSGSPNKGRRKKQHQTFLNMDIYDDLDKEVEVASKAFVLPTESLDDPTPSLNVEDPLQQNPKTPKPQNPMI